LVAVAGVKFAVGAAVVGTAIAESDDDSYQTAALFAADE
jgi:hypothetical protein